MARCISDRSRSGWLNVLYFPFSVTSAICEQARNPLMQDRLCPGKLPVNDYRVRKKMQTNNSAATQIKDFVIGGKRARAQRKHRLEITLNEDEKRAYELHCSKRGITPATCMRSLLHAALREQTVARVVSLPIGERPNRCVEVMLTPSEDALVAIEARRSGFSKSSWIANRVRESLDKSSTRLEEPALTALRTANTALGAVGRNLNQIARKLNAEEGGVSLTAGAVERVHAAVQAHVKAIHDCIVESSARYRIVEIEQ
jgi:hypothetical protein